MCVCAVGVVTKSHIRLSLQCGLNKEATGISVNIYKHFYFIAFSFNALYCQSW